MECAIVIDFTIAPSPGFDGVVPDKLPKRTTVLQVRVVYVSGFDFILGPPNKTW